MTIIFSPSQQAVIDDFPEFLMDDIKEMTIAGFAGSGKTFLVQYLAQMGGKQQEMVKLIDPKTPMRTMLFTATTNKAAHVLETMLNRDVSTIHSCLGLTVQNDYKSGKVSLIKKLAGENLVNTLLFIDEASMINDELRTIIREHTHHVKGCKVIYIGDSYQLPPVMEDVCPVFINATNTYFLKEIQRQVAGSPIIQLSSMYRTHLDDHTLDWPNIANVGNTIMHYANKVDFFTAIETAYKSDHQPDDYKVVAWTNKRVRDYNRWIRSFYGYTAPFEVNEIVVSNKPLFYDHNILAPTDSKHFIDHVEPETRDGVDGFSIRLRGLEYTFFQPASWDQADELKKKYAADAKKTKNWGPYFDIKIEWTDLRPVHASTVHKAQGSTYDEVFIDLNDIGKNNKWREVARLVYVAITRAKNKVHIFGELSRNYNKQPLNNHMAKFTDVKRI